MFLRLARFPLCTTKYRTLEVRLNGFRKQGNDVKVKHAENPKHEILNPKQITSTKLEIPNDYLKFVIWNLFRISIFGFRIYSDFKSAMTSSTERSGTYGRSPPSGSSILRLTRASFFMPTTRKTVRMAFAVCPVDDSAGATASCSLAFGCDSSGAEAASCFSSAETPVAGVVSAATPSLTGSLYAGRTLIFLPSMTPREMSML